MTRFVVERTFESPMTSEQFAALEQRMAPCMGNYRVDWVRSYLSGDRRRMICDYDAPDAFSVRALQQEAGASFDSVWPAEPMEPPETAAHAVPSVRGMTQTLLAAVERIRPILERDAASAEANRVLSVEAYGALESAGLFGMLAPRAHGGLEADLGTFLDVVEAVARIDPAAA
jgi:hypothetical protein